MEIRSEKKRLIFHKSSCFTIIIKEKNPADYAGLLEFIDRILVFYFKTISLKSIETKRGSGKSGVLSSSLTYTFLLVATLIP